MSQTIYPTFGGDIPVGAAVDNNVLSPNGQPTLRLDTAGEIDGNWTPCNEGQTITFTAALKTNPSGISSYDNQGTTDTLGVGIRIGIDFYTSAGNAGISALINGVGNDQNIISGNYGSIGSYVPWNNPNFRTQKISCVVPTGYAIIAFIPWIGVNPNAQASVWAGDISLSPSLSPIQPATANNQITFIAGTGGGISWLDRTNNNTGLTGTFNFAGSDALSVTASPLLSFTFLNFVAVDNSGNTQPQTSTSNPSSYSFASSGGSYTITANFQAPQIITPSTAPSGSISVGGTPYGGYMYLPPPICRALWKLRQKYIRPEVHKKLHPLV